MWFTENGCSAAWRGSRCRRCVRALSASNVGTTSAVLRARVRPNSQATDYHFEYGKTTSYGQETSASTSATA